MKKLNKSTVIGMVIISGILILESLTGLPDFIQGAGLGVGLAFMLTGIYSANFGASKLKDFKKKFFNEYTNRK